MPPRRPRLTNRGGAGLYAKLTLEQRKGLKGPEPRPNGQTTLKPILEGFKGKKNNIAGPLKALIVDIANLNPDPQNARRHPERNMEAIKESLTLFGQVKPLVVRKQGMIVVAGNGTLKAARELGWSKIAANVMEMTEVEAISYGIVDNRSAELAKWDFETVEALQGILERNGYPVIGFTLEELEVMRATDWIPPEDSGEKRPKSITFTSEQRKKIDKFLIKIRQLSNRPLLEEAECILLALRSWFKLLDAEKKEGG